MELASVCWYLCSVLWHQPLISRWHLDDLVNYEAWPWPLLKGLDWWEVWGWPHLHPSCGGGGGKDIGRRDGSSIPGGRVSEGRAGNSLHSSNSGWGGYGWWQPRLSSSGGAVEALVDFFLGILTCQWARHLLMMVRASPTSRLEPLVETTCTPETRCG